MSIVSLDYSQILPSFPFPNPPSDVLITFSVTCVVSSLIPIIKVTRPESNVPQSEFWSLSTCGSPLEQSKCGFLVAYTQLQAVLRNYLAQVPFDQTRLLILSQASAKPLLTQHPLLLMLSPSFPLLGSHGPEPWIPS